MTIQQLRDKRAALVAQARAILDTADKTKRELTAEEDAKFTQLMDEADSLGKQIADREKAEQTAAARTERLNRAEEELRALNRHGVDPRTVAGSAAALQPGGVGQGAISDETRELALRGWFLAQTMRAEPTEEMREAAMACGFALETRVLNLDLHTDYARVRNALKSNVPGSGGVLRLGEFMGPLETAMLAFGPMLDVAQVLRTGDANPLPWPTANDTSNTGRQIGESQAVQATAEPAFGSMTLGAYKFTSDEILVPFELLRDTSINLAAVIGDMLGERLGRVQNTKYTVGSGAGTAFGIVPRSTLGKSATGATAITADELIDLQHSVPRAYRTGAAFMMHDSTVKAIRKLKDEEDRYVWQPGLLNGAPDTLLNWPVYTNDDMAEIASGQKTVLAGQFGKYKIRQVGRIRLYRLTERHRENDQDAFLAFVEADGNLLDPGTGVVRHLIQA